MARLYVSLLGPFQVTLDGQPVTDFKSNKVRALLAYLAVEADRPQRREVLAGLLWPEWPDRDALSNLRYALSNLKRAIGDRARAGDRDAEPPFLLITRDTLQFNTASDYGLDVTAFTQTVEADKMHPSPVDQLEQAIALYHGSFLEGFSIGDSPAFEEWALLTRERLARQMSSALHRLAATYVQRGEYGQAQAHARRQVELEPWDEEAHQQLMRALALGGQRSAALAQYRACQRLLSEELGVEPAYETRRLCEQIRDGELRAAMPTPAPQFDLNASLPPFLEEEPPQVEMPTFVARERELAQLARYLDLALAGEGRAVFVTGESGSGKTALIQEFARRAQEAQAGSPAGSGQTLIVATGNCNAYTGIGDPYLPFREILELLTGEVEARWTAGAMTSEQAHRLWNMLPLAAQALVETGPDLIDTFVTRAGLLNRARALAPGGAGWLTRLEEMVEHKPISAGVPSQEQSHLFRQFTGLLQSLARQISLVLVVDDLQWADAGSINLLFHLGRQLAGNPILIVGAYRPEEIALGRDGARHPLEPVVNEFQRDFGDIILTLGQDDSQEFVEALLDSEPNRLGPSFRAMLSQQTRGHPLFTIELLRGMQERGDLLQDAEGRWVQGPALDWETLPARVEAAIKERIGRLGQPLHAALQVASVEGEVFTAEVIAQVHATDEREVVGHLSGELDRRHRLVHAQAIERLGSRRVSHYRFRNYLFQKYLYDSLDKVERMYLHEDVGNALEELYGDQASEIGDTAATAAVAVQLARHFQEAGITQKAIHYLHQAGERAVQLSAYQEGLTHLSSALTLLKDLPDPRERAEQELTLQLALGMAWIGAVRSVVEAGKAFTRARELCQQTGNRSELCQILGQLAMLHYVRAEHQRALELGEEALNLALQAGDPLHIALNHWRLGFILFALGEYTAARAHLEQTIAFHEPQHHQPFVFFSGSNAGLSAMAYDACSRWCLGFPDQASKHAQEALTLVRELDHPFSQADVVTFAGCTLDLMRRDAPALKASAEELMRLASEKGMPTWLALATWTRGAALTMLGQAKEGSAQLREGIANCQATDALVYLPRALCALAEAQADEGHLEKGLATLAEALSLLEETSERHWEAELYRVKGELHLAQGGLGAAEANLHQAESCFQHAVEAARRQSAKSWELRATTSLARLWKTQGKREEAQWMLAEIYDWFTEGFDTPNLKEAKTLLDELS